jgi:D-alanyl-D-alanine carboxypeptidase (penicillin-binding protein 5/6)
MQEENIINKTYPFHGKPDSKSEDINSDVDTALDAVNNKLNKPRRYRYIKKLLLTLVFILFVGVIGYWFLLWDREPQYLQIGAISSTPNYFQEDLELKPRNEVQIGEIDLSSIEARSIIAFNPVNYQVFVESNSEEKVAVASITKLITAAVAIEEFDMDDILTFKEIHDEPLPTSLGLQTGESMSFDDALNALLVGSKNDVAFLIAQNYDGGYEGFIEAMNRKAQLLGMYNSSFSNPAGFDDVNNYSTAKDLKKLALFAIRNKEISSRTQAIKIDVAVKDSVGIERTQSIDTTNYLLGSSPYIKGLKTGSTLEAGKCFIGYFYANDEDQLITIILNSKEDRFDQTQELVKIVNEAFTTVADD